MKTQRILFRHPLLQAGLLYCCMLSGAQAGDDHFLIHDSEGFTHSLPNVSTITVTQHLQELQQDLKNELGTLQAELKRKSFKAIDTLITIVMPGGLLYAKLRHDSYKRSEHRVNRVSDELAQISGELVSFQADSSDLMLATSE
jgi:hypothetical protein